MTYTLDTRIDGEFDEIVTRTTDALADEGFGVLCDIDVQRTLKDKLDADFRRYRILGACNPQLAHEALGEELLLGSLLPCNVVVYETNVGEVGVSAIDPEAMLAVADNPELDPIAADVRERFERVLSALSDDRSR